MVLIKQGITSSGLVRTGLVQRGVGPYDPDTAPFYSPAWDATSSRRASVPALTISGDFTFCCKVRFPAIAATQNSGQFSKLSGATNRLHVGINGTSRFFTFGVGGSPFLTTGKVLNVDVEYELKVMRVGSQVTAYVDGVQEGSTTDSTVLELDNFYIGGRGVVGTVSEFLVTGARIWDVVLLDHTTPSNSRKYPVVEYRPTRDVSGTTLQETLNGQDGTLVNFPVGTEWELAKLSERP